jgi:hypothetical protein
MSVISPSRDLVAMEQFGRFKAEADIRKLRSLALITYEYAPYVCARPAAL